MKEIRVTEIRANEPTADGEKALILSGRPVVYDTPTRINDISGSYIEIIERGALDNADLHDVRLLVGHDTSKIPLARTPKTMSLVSTTTVLRLKRRYLIPKPVEKLTKP